MKYVLLKHAVYYSFLFSPTHITDLLVTPLLWLHGDRIWGEVVFDYKFMLWGIALYAATALWIIVPAEALAKRYMRYCRQSWET